MGTIHAFMTTSPSVTHADSVGLRLRRERERIRENQRESERKREQERERERDGCERNLRST